MVNNFLEIIKDYYKSEYMQFSKYYLYFLILFTIVFYTVGFINKNTQNYITIIETKIFFYITILFFFILLNDMLDFNNNNNKNIFTFIFTLFFTLFFIYFVIYLVNTFYNKSFIDNLFVVIPSIFVFFIIMSIYFLNQNKNLLETFVFSMTKNFWFFIFLLFFSIIYLYTFYSYDLNTTLTDILQPYALSSLLLFCIFCFFIFVGLKIKLISNIKILNTIISLSSIFLFLLFLSTYIFMSSLDTICSEKNNTNPQNSIAEQEFVFFLIIISIIILLWLRDTRNWEQYGSIIFIIISIITLYCMFFYSVKYPSTSLLSFWLFIEWLMVVFYKKENTKNSIHYSFLLK